MSIPVCFMIVGSKEIEWANCVGHGQNNYEAILKFDDGGWNPASDCFLQKSNVADTIRKIVESLDM